MSILTTEHDLLGKPYLIHITVKNDQFAFDTLQTIIKASGVPSTKGYVQLNIPFDQQTITATINVQELPKELYNLIVEYFFYGST